MMWVVYPFMMIIYYLLMALEWFSRPFVWFIGRVTGIYR